MTGFFSEHSLETNAIELAVRERKAKGLPLIDLTNTNPTQCGFFFPSSILIDQAREYYSSRKYRPDPKGYIKARESIAHYYKRRSPSFNISPEQIFLTSSTSEAYSLLFSLLANPGDNILAPSITYPLFDLLAEHHRLHLKPYILSKATSWEINQRSILEEKDSQTKAILIVSPHNPTGHTYTSPLKAVSDAHLPIICDEVFSEFFHGGQSSPPLAAFHRDIPVFTLNGISKMFALPDMKLGWIALNETAYSLYGARLELLNDTFLGANYLIQSTLPTLFEKGWAFVQSMKNSIEGNIKFAMDLLNVIPGVSIIAPPGGYMLVISLDKAVDEEAVVIELINQGLLTHPGFFYGDIPGSSLVISCLPEKQFLEAGIEILRQKI